jgi:hypothetical protein
MISAQQKGNLMENDSTIEHYVPMCRARLEFTGTDKLIGEIVYGGNVHYGISRRAVPPIPGLVQEKITLLDIRGQGHIVPQVGKKQSDYIYYLHFDAMETDTIMHEEQDSA